ncbi:MAG: thioredoxin [Coriobacteriia bacterium]
MSSAKDVTSGTWEAEVVNSSVPVVVDFWAAWCGPCRMVAPEIDKLAARAGDKVKFVKLNIDENRDIAERYRVMSIPTIIKFERGEATEKAVGARGADDLNAALKLGV